MRVRNRNGIPELPGKREFRQRDAMKKLGQRLQDQIEQANTANPELLPYLSKRLQVVEDRIQSINDANQGDDLPLAVYRGMACRVGIVSRKGRKVIVLDFDSMSDHLPSGDRLAEVPIAMPHNALPEYEAAIKNTPKNREVMAALERADLVKPTGRMTWAERIRVPVWNINGGREK